MTIADPSYIPLHADPREQRFVGVTAHGHHYFDVPYMSQITDTLWVGGCKTGLVLPDEIENLVSLYRWEAYAVGHELQSSLTVKMFDSLDQGLDQVLSIAEWVRARYKAGPTLVHCQAGLNRSNLISATALILDGMEPQAAIDLLREKRSPAVLCNSSFEEWLLDLPTRYPQLRSDAA